MSYAITVIVSAVCGCAVGMYTAVSLLGQCGYIVIPPEDQAVNKKDKERRR